MKMKRHKSVRQGLRLKRRNPVARALIERALGERVMPGPKRYTRKSKHPKRLAPERD